MLLCLFTITGVWGDDVNCSVGPAPGSCADNSLRWYYDMASDQCKPFIYGGCGGNTNNFKTQEQCEARCADHGKWKCENVGSDVWNALYEY